MGKAGKTLLEIGEYYGVSKERIRQLYVERGINPRDVGVQLRTRESREEAAARLYKNRGDPTQELYEAKRSKWRGKKGNAASRRIECTIPFSEIEWPTHCPVLGIELEYQPLNGRQENSVSFDRIDATKGYVSGNVIVVSWRANRIKNDGTPEEHQLIADFYK